MLANLHCCFHEHLHLHLHNASPRGRGALNSHLSLRSEKRRREGEGEGRYSHPAIKGCAQEYYYAMRVVRAVECMTFKVLACQADAGACPARTADESKCGVRL